ncbi:MAG TPA: hypothetical protein VFF65_04390 [Phycisphaerales bacterium]|nr:hypothetical protein [Phycisphaerales bacterium]
MKSTGTLFAAVVAAAVTSAGAQSINIDFGTANATPAAGYSAAAGLGGTGFWNAYAGGPMALADLSGSPTGAAISGGATGFLGSSNDPATLGDDDLMVDDFIGIPFIDTWTVTGLAAGTYDVYGYTWTFTALPSGFDVNGQGVQAVGGAWPGSFQPGLYSLHTVTLAASQPLVVNLYSINGAIGVISGLQIVQVPAPSAAALVACSALASCRRRRR